jgi:hypothetical protein
MNKRRRFKAKRRRGMPACFKRAAFPWWRVKMPHSSHPLTWDVLGRFEALYFACDSGIEDDRPL